MWLKWLPWKYLVQRAARAYGFVDPITFLARMRQFAQPSEIQEPLDLLRAGIVFHARGLLNTRAIQHNLDWVWPYWVERQFNPDDPSFIPRAFSFSHINLTHRNWTAVGLPDLPCYPLVDPRGLVTPHYDGWSLDFWVLTSADRTLLPSRAPAARQVLEMNSKLAVVTHLRQKGLALRSRVFVERSDSDGGKPFLVIRVNAETDAAGWLAATLRPYNPEGIHFIETLDYDQDRRLRVNDKTSLRLSLRPDRLVTSTYADGDVLHKLLEEKSTTRTVCSVGMITAAALYHLEARQPRDLEIRIALESEKKHAKKMPLSERKESWAQWDTQCAALSIPDKQWQYLYDASVKNLLLLSAGDVVPGPFTYRRFWFRDAVQMIHALLALNLTDRSRRLLGLFFKRQTYAGYFESQEGEWDSNGQVLWIMDLFQRVTHRDLQTQWLPALFRGAEWIRRKRRATGGGHLHSGLLPAGFSAEHLGPNDYYYWDDFWSVGGLYGAARLARLAGSEDMARLYTAEARELSDCIFQSIAAIDPSRSGGAIPASPYRRMDAGAIGSLAADYPLRLTRPGDPRIRATVNFLIRRCFRSGGFFQDMIHSGINAYLTLTVAQVLLRCADQRFRDLMRAIADLASDTGQWPEAIHPITRGGCMGDGQHGWAAAEWIMMIRNLFIREEGETLIIGSGINPEWLEHGQDLVFGPTATPFGSVTVRIITRNSSTSIELAADWHAHPPQVILNLPGFERQTLCAPQGLIPLETL